VNVAADYVIHVMLVFCRLGAMFMVMPGTSSARLPMNVRLLLAVTMSWMISPLIPPFSPIGGGGLSLDRLAALIAGEIVIGIVLGLLARLYIAALEFLMTAAASYLGFNPLPGTPVVDEDAGAILATLMTTSAVMLFLTLDLHWLLIGALVESYANIAISTLLDFELAGAVLLGGLTDATYAALQITGPLLLYALLVNMLFGIINRLIPTVPAHFLSIPFLLYGGLLLLCVLSTEALLLFLSRIQSAIQAL
jgi:flagellar biosynthetic protein FliR